MNLKKILSYIKNPLLLIPAVGFLSLLLLANPLPVLADTGVINSSVVNIRSGPGTNYDIEGTIYEDTDVTILESKNGWYKIQLGKLTGWASSSLVDAKIQKKVQVTKDLVNLRTGPGTSYDKAGQAAKGDILILLGEEEEWYKVKDTKGNTAYIASFLVQIVNTDSSDNISAGGDSSGSSDTETAPVTPAAGQKKIQVLSGPINVRSGPGSNHDKVGMIGDKAIFAVTGEEGNWYKIQLADGKNAWVAGWLVKVIENSEPAAKPAVPAADNTKPPVVILDNKQLSFEVPPVIENGRTLVPLRAIFEAMGANVQWNNSTRTVTATKATTTVVLPVGSTAPTINGSAQKLDVPAKIVNDRTLAPLRFVGEAFGGKVAWNGTTRMITITTPFALLPSNPDTPAKPDKEQEKKYKVAAVNEGTVNLRSGPASDYDKIDEAQTGEKLVILDEKNGWYQVSRGAKRGWLAGWVIDVAWEEGEPIIDPEDSSADDRPGSSDSDISDPDQEIITKPEKPSEDVIWLSSSRDETGIKITMESGARLKADIKETRSKITYEFEDRNVEGLNFIKESVAGKDLKVRGKNEENNALVEIEIPYGTEYQTASEEGGKIEILTIPNFIAGVERKPFGSSGERLIIKTIAPVKCTAEQDNDKLEIKLENVFMGKARDEYEYSSELLEGMTVKESGKSDTVLIIDTKDLGKYAFGAGGDGNDLNIILTGKANIKPRKENLVVIDPGHGGIDSGARGNGLLEKDPNLEIALKIGKLLEKKGIEVEYTRTTDKTVGLEERSEIANKLNAALFVSVHNNSTLGGPDKQGTETHYYAPVNDPELFLQKAERERLATIIQKHMMNKLKRVNRGVKHSNFSVLRNTKMPSVLCEIVFVSNPEEARLLKQPYFKNLAAEAIATGIAEYMGK